MLYLQLGLGRVGTILKFKWIDGLRPNASMNKMSYNSSRSFILNS